MKMETDLKTVMPETKTAKTERRTVARMPTLALASLVVMLVTSLTSRAEALTMPSYTSGSLVSSLTQADGKKPCLDVPSSTFVSDTPIQIYTCNGTSAQRWMWTAGASMVFKLRDTSLPALYLSKYDGTSDVTINSPLWTYPYQTWNFRSNQVVGVGSDKCVDRGASTTSGTQLKIYSCSASNTNNNQKWFFDSDFTIRVAPKAVAAGKFLCWDVPGFNYDWFTPINIYTCNGGSNQKWTLRPGGSISPQGYEGTWCVRVRPDNSKLELFGCDGSPSQRFLIRGALFSGLSATATAVTNSDGAYCLDVPSSDSRNATLLQIFPCHNGRNQR